MTNDLIPSKRFEVWSRLYGRFLLEPWPAEGGSKAAVSAVIQPVTQADELVKRSTVVQGSGQFTASSAEQNVVYTVPAGVRQRVYAYAIERSQGDNTWRRLSLRDISANLFLLIHDGTGFVDLAFPGSTPLVMDAGDDVLVTSETAGILESAFRWTAWVDEEDVF